MLFDAEWIVSTRQLVLPVAGRPWERLRHRDDLVEWEAVWQGNGDRRRLFKTELLDDERVTFLASYAHDHVVAGAILNRSVGVGGISNFFPGQGAGREAWHECVSLAQELNPGVPLVGYGSGASLDQALESGFATAGPLRVWVHDG